MQLSRWCHVLHRNGVSAFLNKLNFGVVYVPTDELHDYTEKLRSSRDMSDDELTQLLVSQGLLVENQFEDERTFIDVRDRLKSRISLELIYLLVTDGCNLQCTYCFEETPSLSGPFRTTKMTGETIIKALDLFATIVAQSGSPDKEKVIHLYGGEPLANRKAVYAAVTYANELKAHDVLPDNCQIAIVTNGTLLNEDDARFFAKNKVTVGLSIDGPAAITDFYRIPKRQDIRVTERITAAFHLLKHYSVKVGLSVTLTPQAVDHFDEFLAFFTDGEFRSADGVSLNLLHFNPAIKLSENYYRAAVECQIKAFERFREIGLYEERVMRKVSAFADQEPMYSDCGVVGNQLVIAPDGSIGVCHDFVKPRTYFTRSVYDASHCDLIETLFADWRDRSPFFMPQCLACSAIGICGGGCPANAELKTGNRHNLDERACYHSKQILEWLVWDAYAKLDNK